jgi:hypothetical protein
MLLCLILVEGFNAKQGIVLRSTTQCCLLCLMCQFLIEFGITIKRSMKVGYAEDAFVVSN